VGSSPTFRTTFDPADGRRRIGRARMAAAKDLLLINPWIYDFTAYDFWLKPLGLLYVAALLERSGAFRVSFIDCLDRRHPGLEKPPPMKPDGRGPLPKVEVPKPAPLEGVPRRFSRYGLPVRLFEEELAACPQPEAVLLTSAMTYWYPGVQAAVDLVRRRFGSVPVILGGVYATLCPEHARTHSGADVVIIGPGERSLFATLRSVLGDGLPPDSGLDGLDALPSPAFGRLRDRTWLPVLTSRGCPFRCTFCASSLLADKFEQRPAASVAAEIESHHARFGTRHFAFYDDALLVDKERHALPLLERIAAAALPVRLHAPNGLHIREIDIQTASRLRAAGVDSIYLSLESSDEALVRERTPKTSPGELAAALTALQEAGYARRDVSIYLIVGLPGQGAEGVVESIRFVRGLGATPRVAFFSPIPGTAEWETLRRRGAVTDASDPLLHNKIAFSYLGSDITAAELDRIKKVLTEKRAA
jgi:radical SAM superfamily enzyme YgiQ (UPF0313 family)